MDNWVAEKDDIQLYHLLNMNTGLDCNDHSGTSAGNESRMYRERDWYRFLLEQKMIYTLGEHYAYCTAGVNMLGGIILKASGARNNRVAISPTYKIDDYVSFRVDVFYARASAKPFKDKIGFVNDQAGATLQLIWRF